MLVTDLPLWPKCTVTVPAGIEVRRGTSGEYENVVAFVVYRDGQVHKHVTFAPGEFGHEAVKAAIANLGHFPQ